MDSKALLELSLWVDFIFRPATFPKLSAISAVPYEPSLIAPLKSAWALQHVIYV
jgi:hypothetical protein